MKKAVWGVLGTAKIGWEKVIPAMLKSEYCEVRAIASRTLDKAEQLAKQRQHQVMRFEFRELFHQCRFQLIDPCHVTA